LELPFSTDYTAERDGTPPLGKLKDWLAVKDSQGQPAERESQTMPTWAGSSWYFIRYVDPNNNNAFADYEKMKYWLPVDRYFGGAEHTTVHLLYSRFWFRFFYDLGLVPYSEPYSWRMNGGIMLGPDGKKMSKRLGNVMEPGVLIDNYGADATRLSVVFIGPYSETYPWNQNIIKAMWRLVKTIYDQKEKVKPTENAQIKTAYAKLVTNITDMCENLKMNTAISEIMIFVNELKKVDAIDPETWKGFIKVLAPFAPFLAEELWQEVNNFATWDKHNSVHLQSWPQTAKGEVPAGQQTIPVMINGKVRGRITTDPNESEHTLKERIQKDEKFVKHLQGEVKKFVFVPGKIVSVSV